ncbi:MAG: hypothetical protein AB4368_19105 [Xenococcaceae cyanobacterium]
MLKLNDVQLNSDADKQAVQSLGINSESDRKQAEKNSNLDIKQIKDNLIYSNSNNGHVSNGNSASSSD